ncbi:hypothetical protein JQ616_37130 [Bradyrhizobium tropiciagri]|uniref:pilus assembly protein TadG-related protein n=1 Tax=Bradyrhizobium tropiciagri TaxID=312253 RepID=UPI001BAD72A8|nr:pilus assembly protein TadG-related protein [Bradyrhizobium tropiciagri]MBR0900610.1 hypothetical protein [Bradyrhizobium tropiciagri]
MRDMLRCRRGSAAFATVLALIPLIGMMALGGEAGSWYATRQRAQGAADAAAYSGALRLACDQAPQPGTTCDNAQTYDYRGKQAAAQNSFCNSGDPSYSGSTCAPSLPSGVSKSVQMATWATGGVTFVQATVGQQQPAYLARVLGLSTINVAAVAIAQIDSLAKPPCVLALKDPVTFQGSATVSSATCGISSDSSASNAIGFIGNSGLSINAPSYTVGGCSQTGGSQCTGVQTYQQPIPDPLSAVNAALSALTTSNFASRNNNAAPLPYETCSCYNTNPNFPSNTVLNGTYYFSGNVKINMNPTITGTATLIFFGSGTSLTITGTPTIQLTAMTSPAPTGPSVLSASVKALMKDLLIYDGEAYSKQGVNISGTSTSYFNGTVYVPNAPVTYGGNSSSSAPTTGCYQVIAYAVTFQGNTTLDNSTCTSGGGAKPNVQTVRLVQ